ncbi:MAG: type VI secretion system tube protein TssD [Candidatus Sumerlaeota bacterium]|nr:type VI secretion system tube protein TssD [Candidatus Sumerlaeota bacterium]
MKRAFKVLALLGAAMACVTSTPCLAATPCNLTIPGIPGSSEKDGRVGTIDVFAVDHELATPIDAGTGLPSGARQHHPLTILKQIDKASPLLYQVLVTGQDLGAVVLDFYRIDPDTRQEVKYYTITLGHARLIGVKLMMPTSFDPAYETYQHMEEVRFTYQSIEWKWIPENIVFMDYWGAPPGQEPKKTDTAGSPKTSQDAAKATKEDPKKGSAEGS